MFLHIIKETDTEKEKLAKEKKLNTAFSEAFSFFFPFEKVSYEEVKWISHILEDDEKKKVIYSTAHKDNVFFFEYKKIMVKETD